MLNRDNMIKDTYNVYVTAPWKFTRFAIYSMRSFKVLKANSYNSDANSLTKYKMQSLPW